MENLEANGQRFLASTDRPLEFHDVAMMIKHKFGEEARYVTTKVLPNWLDPDRFPVHWSSLFLLYHNKIK